MNLPVSGKKMAPVRLVGMEAWPPRHYFTMSAGHERLNMPVLPIRQTPSRLVYQSMVAESIYKIQRLTLGYSLPPMKGPSRLPWRATSPTSHRAAHTPPFPGTTYLCVGEGYPCSTGHSI